MKNLTLAFVGAFLSAAVLSAANDPADEKAVMDTLESMAKATIAKDVATLDNIYGDEVTYSHSTSAQRRPRLRCLPTSRDPTSLSS